jgi:preprotein translocase subunit YajC
MKNDLIITNSYAQVQESKTNNSQEFSFMGLMPMILIFAIFYFLIIRPQSKKMKDHKTMIDNIKVGDKVITNGGIFGLVKSIDQKENHLEIEISENVNVKILRGYVADIIKDEKNKTNKKK